MKTILIAGLGNPGKKYEKTRHNAGFMFVDYFWKEYPDKFGFSDWELKKKLNAEISVGKINRKSPLPKNWCGDKKIILMKPQTFMNLSGDAVSSTVKYFIRGETSNSLIVVHDEIDLPLGSFRFSKDSSAAGHKGVQSVIDTLGTKNFLRLRIGIDNRDKPAFAKASAGRKIATEKYVLGKLSDAELKLLRKTLEKSVSEFLEKIKK